MLAASIVIHEGPSTLEFLGSLVVAGVLAPLAAAWQTRSSDRRRFRHEREQNATGDLIERIEDLLNLLDDLGARCAELRQLYLGPQMKEAEELWRRVLAGEDAYQKVRLAIARLGMRPHADDALIKKAEEAAAEFFKAVHTVRGHVIRHRLGEAGNKEPFVEPPIETVIGSIDKGYELTKEYAALARIAIAKLQGPPA
jgi:hypothetical protein